MVKYFTNVCMVFTNFFKKKDYSTKTTEISKIIISIF